MTRQEIFDKVVKHLLAQGAKSVTYRESGDQFRCLYRGPNGLMCAVGCLIPDEEYGEWMEDLPVRDLRNGASTGPITFSLVEDHLRLLQDLQYIHDNHEVENWHYMLRDYAEQNALEFRP